MKKTIVQFLGVLLLASLCFGQGGNPPVAITGNNPTLDSVTFPVYSLNPAPVPNATIAVVGNPGQATWYFWASANYQLGSVISYVGTIDHAPNTLTSGNYVTIFPTQYPSGVTSVDILATHGPNAPTGVCNCAVATGLTSGGANFQSNSLSSYTVLMINPPSFNLRLTNEVTGSGVTHLLLRNAYTGVLVCDLSIGCGGGGTGCVVSPTNASGVVFLNPGATCASASDFLFRDADASHGNAPTLSIGTGLQYFDNSNVSPGAGIPWLQLGSNSFPGLLDLVGPGGTALLKAPGPYFSDSSINTPGGALGIGSPPSVFVGFATQIDPCVITAISSTSNVVSVTGSFCDFPAGVWANITGVADSTFNGQHLITGVTSNSGVSEIFTYSLTGSNRSSSGGHAALYAGDSVLASAGQLNNGAHSMYFYASTNTDAANNGTGMQFTVGSGGNNTPGGPIFFQAGNTANASGNKPGGAINLSAGNSDSGNNDGGTITLTPGAASGSGTAGHIQLAGNVTITGTCTGCPSGGGTVNVNGSSVSSPNFNSTTPAATNGLNNGVFQVSSSSVSLELFTNFVDLADGYTSGDPCAYANTVMSSTLVSAGNYYDLGGFIRFFADGNVPCQSNPWENLVLSGTIDLGPLHYVKSVPWVTPGQQQRVTFTGSGTADVGTGTAAVNTVVQDCGSQAPGWNGSACVVHGITVAAYGASGHSVTYTYPHGAVQAGTYYPSFWLGGMGSSAVTLAGSFGQVVKNFTIWPGAGGGNFGLYATGPQEQSRCDNVTVRASNDIAIFLDRAQGTATGPSHMQIDGCTGRMDDANTAAQGYPVVGSTAMGYGTWYEGNADQIYFTGGTCTQYPQGYPSTISGAAITVITMTYPGTCSNLTGLACHVGSNRGTGETCGFTNSGTTITGITAGGVGTGYSLGDTQGGGIVIENATINGDNTKNMQNAVVIDGCYSCKISQIHTGFDADYGIVVGYGSGAITGGLFENNDLENASKGVYHLGNGIDKNQVVLTTGKGGSVATIKDDACSFTSGTSTAISEYDPCSLYIPAGQQPVYQSGLKVINGGGGATTFNVTGPGAITATEPTGSIWGGATGGAQGAGTINATGLFVNGVAVGTGAFSPTITSPANTQTLSYNGTTWVNGYGGVSVDAQTGDYTFSCPTDRLGELEFNITAAHTLSLPQAGATACTQSSMAMVVRNTSTSTAILTVSATTSTFQPEATSSINVLPGGATFIYSDATSGTGNYHAIPIPTAYGGIDLKTANYTLTLLDKDKLVVMNCSSGCAATMPATPPSAKWNSGIISIGSTLATVSLNSLTYNGGASAPALIKYMPLRFTTDGSNYFGDVPLVAGSGITLTPAANGVTVASSLAATGTSAMGTGAITSGTCATVVTTAATGAATSSTIIATPTVDPTGVTGYGPSASGSLYIQAYPTSGNVNFKVCNNTAGSITPAALTLNWRVF